MRNLPGLTPAWLISLAAILAFLVGLGGEAFSRGLYEFLKDFQTAIVGVWAFGLAYWAAGPVFGQMKETRRQAAILTYEMLRQSYAALSEEYHVLGAGLRHLATADLFETAAAADIVDIELLGHWSEQFQEDANRIRQFSVDYEKFKIQPTALETIRNDRVVVTASLVVLYLDQEEARRVASEICLQYRTKVRND